MNTFEFKQNFSIFRQNIVLKKQNIELSEKVKTLGLRLEKLYEKFRVVMVQKKQDSYSREQQIQALRTSSTQKYSQHLPSIPNT